MLEYKVVNAHDFVGAPDEKRAQKACEEAAADGWRLVTAISSPSGGGARGKLLLFFEREVR